MEYHETIWIHLCSIRLHTVKGFAYAAHTDIHVQCILVGMTLHRSNLDWLKGLHEQHFLCYAILQLPREWDVRIPSWCVPIGKLEKHEKKDLFCFGKVEEFIYIKQYGIILNVRTPLRTFMDRLLSMNPRYCRPFGSLTLGFWDCSDFQIRTFKLGQRSR